MNKKLLWFAVAALIALGWAGYRYWQTSGGVSSVKAVVEGHLVFAGASVPGTVKEVYVKAGDSVARDQPLLALDPSGYEARLARERTQLAEAAAQLPPDLKVPSPRAAQRVVPGKPLAALRQEEDSARMAVEAAAQEYAAANLALSRLQATADLASPSPDRQRALIARDEAARTLQRAKISFEQASYARAQREAQDKTDRANGTVSAALAARMAEYQARLSLVRLAEENLAATVVTAPESGRILAQTARPNGVLAAGDMPVTILPDDSGEMRVLAFFAREAADALTPGRECSVLADGGKTPLPATIDGVQPAPDGEKNVAVRVILDQDALAAGLLPGNEVTVLVRTGGPAFFYSFFGKTKK